MSRVWDINRGNILGIWEVILWRRIVAIRFNININILVKMCLKLTVLLLGLSTSLVLARRLQAPLVVDENIRQLHSESLVLAESHQAKSTPCFTIYNPQLNQITNNYEVAYEKCISAYEACSKSIENHYKPARLELESTVSQSCDALSNCNGWSNSYTAFTCASTQVSITFVHYQNYTLIKFNRSFRLPKIRRTSMRCLPTLQTWLPTSRRTMFRATLWRPCALTMRRGPMLRTRLGSMANWIVAFWAMTFPILQLLILLPSTQRRWNTTQRALLIKGKMTSNF